MLARPPAARHACSCLWYEAAVAVEIWLCTWQISSSSCSSGYLTGSCSLASSFLRLRGGAQRSWEGHLQHVCGHTLLLPSRCVLFLQGLWSCDQSLLVCLSCTSRAECADQSILDASPLASSRAPPGFVLMLPMPRADSSQKSPRPFSTNLWPRLVLLQQGCALQPAKWLPEGSALCQA